MKPNKKFYIGIIIVNILVILLFKACQPEVIYDVNYINDTTNQVITNNLDTLSIK